MQKVPDTVEWFGAQVERLVQPLSDLNTREQSAPKTDHLVYESPTCRMDCIIIPLVIPDYLSLNSMSLSLE